MASMAGKEGRTHRHSNIGDPDAMGVELFLMIPDPNRNKLP